MARRPTWPTGIETVVSQRLAELDKELARTVTASPEVEILEEVAEYVHLRMQDHRARGKDVSFGEILMDYVTVSPEYAVTGDDADELTTAREAIAAAVNGDVDHDKAAKCALGEIAAHNASGGDPVPDAREQLESVLGAPDDEKQHFAKQALRLLE